MLIQLNSIAQIVLGVALIGVMLLLLLYLLAKLVGIAKGNRSVPSPLPGIDIINLYQKELDKMILYHSAYEINIMIGEKLNQTNGGKVELNNDELNELINLIFDHVVANMGDAMSMTLGAVFGTDWILKYVNIQVMSMVLNYDNLNITNLTDSLYE